MKRSLLLLLAVSLALPAPAAAADRFRSIEPLTSGETLADVAWVHEPNVRVLDDRTGNAASFPLPGDCAAPSALGAGHIAAVCLSGIQLMDLTTGTWTLVPPSRTSAELLTKERARVAGVGREWLAIATGDWDSPDVAWVRRTTGRVVTKDPGNLRAYPNLDAPGLWRRLCAPLTRRRNPSRFGARFIGPQMIGRRGLDVTGHTMIMRRCGTNDVKVVTRSTNAGESWFGGTRVSWYEAFLSRYIGPKGRTCQQGCIRTFDATTGRFRSFPDPPIRPV